MLLLTVDKMKFALMLCCWLLAGKMVAFLLHFRDGFNVLWLKSVVSLLFMCFAVDDLVDSMFEFIEMS